MKKIIAVLLSISTIFVFVACSSGNTASNVTPDTVDATTTTEEVTTSEVVTTTEETTTAATTKAVEYIAVQDNEVITIDGVCEFYIEQSSVTDSVEPPYPEGYYRKYDAEEGKTFVDVVLNYKNLDTESVRGDKAIAGSNLFYNKDYKYGGFAAVEESSRSTFAISGMTVQIQPLTSEYIHIMFQVPDEVADDEDGTLEVKFTIDKKTMYTYKVR